MTEPRQGPPAAARDGAALRASVLASFLLGLVAALGFGAPLGVPCLDDAYIHLAYAASLGAGDGLAYNPGDHELGITSPLWVLLLALVPHGAMIAVQILGALLHAVSAALGAALAAAIPSPPGAGGLALGAAVAGALVALHPLLLQGATSGMEVPLTVALLALATLAAVRERAPLAAVAGGLAVLARPEALVVMVAVAAIAWLATRKRAAAAPALGALVGQGVFSAYCELVAGWPLPNTFYVKAHGASAESLEYVVTRVLTQEAWLVGVGGAVVLGIGVWRAAKAREPWIPGLVLAWIVALVAVATSRHLPGHVLFYAQRYFAVVAFLPAVVVGAATGSDRRFALAAATALVPLALQLPATRALVLAQEQDIRLLHLEPAAYVASELPADATVLVEGAGAMRFLAPRTMRIVDLAGLNDGVIAHADARARPCAWIARRPTHLAIPSELVSTVRTVFDGEVLRRFEDPAYSQVTPPSRRSVYVIRVTAVRPSALEACRALLTPSAQAREEASAP